MHHPQSYGCLESPLAPSLPLSLSLSLFLPPSLPLPLPLPLSLQGVQEGT